MSGGEMRSHKKCMKSKKYNPDTEICVVCGWAQKVYREKLQELQNHDFSHTCATSLGSLLAGEKSPVQNHSQQTGDEDKVFDISQSHEQSSAELGVSADPRKREEMKK